MSFEEIRSFLEKPKTPQEALVAHFLSAYQPLLERIWLSYELKFRTGGSRTNATEFIVTEFVFPFLKGKIQIYPGSEKGRGLLKGFLYGVFFKSIEGFLKKHFTPSECEAFLQELHDKCMGFDKVDLEMMIRMVKECLEGDVFDKILTFVDREEAGRGKLLSEWDSFQEHELPLLFFNTISYRLPNPNVLRGSEDVFFISDGIKQIVDALILSLFPSKRGMNISLDKFQKLLDDLRAEISVDEDDDKEEDDAFEELEFPHLDELPYLKQQAEVFFMRVATQRKVNRFLLHGLLGNREKVEEFADRFKGATGFPGLRFIVKKNKSKVHLMRSLDAQMHEDTNIRRAVEAVCRAVEYLYDFFDSGILFAFRGASEEQRYQGGIMMELARLVMGKVSEYCVLLESKIRHPEIDIEGLFDLYREIEDMMGHLTTPDVFLEKIKREEQVSAELPKLGE